MDHLSYDEIIDFIRIRYLDEEAMILIKKVNAHIGKCENCSQKVKLFQKIQDNLDEIELCELKEIKMSKKTKVEIKIKPKQKSKNVKSVIKSKKDKS